VYSPSQGAPNAPITGNFVLTFSEYVQAGTGSIVITPSCTPSDIHYPCTATTIDIQDSQVSISGTNVVVDPIKNLLITFTGIPYTFTMGAGTILDSSNNAHTGIAGDTYRVISNPDKSRPTILTFSPSQGSAEVRTSPNLMLIFDESVQAGTGNIILTPTHGSLVTIPVSDRQVTFSAALVTINPSSPLQAGMQYSMSMVADVIKDTYASNGFIGMGVSAFHVAYSFTTSEVGGLSRVSFVSAGKVGYMHDTGSAYAYHADNGRTYGWKCDGVPTNFSSVSNSQAWGMYMDRNNDCSGTTSWEIAVADGVYDITVVMPQGNHATCKIEGDFSGGTSGAFTYTKQVTVNDGSVEVKGEFPSCHGMQEILIAVPGGDVDNGCTNQLDGKVCGPVEDLHLAAGECILMVKPAGSQCDREFASVSEPLNPVHMMPVPSDPSIAPILRV